MKKIGSKIALFVLLSGASASSTIVANELTPVGKCALSCALGMASGGLVKLCLKQKAAWGTPVSVACAAMVAALCGYKIGQIDFKREVGAHNMACLAGSAVITAALS